MSDKTISVIIPVYNGESYISKCLDSIVNQTYKELEVIVVNDGSTDTTRDIIEGYKSKIYNLIILDKPNGGLSDARNYGMKYATGEYIAFLDSDDWVDYDYYELLYKNAQLHNTDITVVGFLWVTDNHYKKPNFYNSDQLLSGNDAIKELANDRYLSSHAWNKLYKRELWDGIQFPYGRLYEDVFIMHKVFNRAKKVYIIADYKHYYLMRSNSIIHNTSARNWFEQFYAFRSRYEDLKYDFPEVKIEMLERIFEIVLNIFYIHPLKIVEKRKYKDDINQVKTFLKNECNNVELSFKRKIMCKYPMIYGIVFKNRGYIKNIANKIKREKKLEKLNDPNAIIYIGAAEYGNIGDVAITYFSCMFIKKNHGKNLILITENEFKKYKKQILKYAKVNNSSVILQGGGNMGSMYEEQEIIRREVINSLKTNKILIFPSTIYYGKDKVSTKKELEQKKLYSNKSNLIIFARENESYRIMKNNFINTKICLVPDIVLSAKKMTSTRQRHGAVLCMRSDEEGIFNVNQLQEIKKIVSNITKDYYLYDTVDNETHTIDTHKDDIGMVLDKFIEAKFVVTDRLHGMILAFITNTPCIALATCNHKLISSIKWMENGKCIICHDVNNIKASIEKAMSITIDNSIDSCCFNDLINLLSAM